MQPRSWFGWLSVEEMKTDSLGPPSCSAQRDPICCRGPVCEPPPGIRAVAKDSCSGGHKCLFVPTNESPLVPVTRRWSYYILTFDNENASPPTPREGVGARRVAESGYTAGWILYPSSSASGWEVQKAFDQELVFILFSLR